MSATLNLVLPDNINQKLENIVAKHGTSKADFIIELLTHQFFDTEEVDYDAWFREKVEAALHSTKPAIPHDEVVARVRHKLAERVQNAG